MTTGALISAPRKPQFSKIEAEFQARFGAEPQTAQAEVAAFFVERSFAREDDTRFAEALASFLAGPIGPEQAVAFLEDLARFLGASAWRASAPVSNELFHVVRTASHPWVSIAPHLADGPRGEIALVLPRGRAALRELGKDDWAPYRLELKNIEEDGASALLICPYYLLSTPAFPCLSRRHIFPLFEMDRVDRTKSIAAQFMGRIKLSDLASWLEGVDQDVPDGKARDAVTRERLSRLLGDDPESWNERQTYDDLRKRLVHLAGMLTVSVATSPGEPDRSTAPAIAMLVEYSAGLPVNAVDVFASALRAAQGNDRTAYIHPVTAALRPSNAGLAGRLMRRMREPTGLSDAAMRAIVETLILHADMLYDGSSFVPLTRGKLESLLAEAITGDDAPGDVVTRLERIGVLIQSSPDGRSGFLVDPQNGLLSFLMEEAG